MRKRRMVTSLIVSAYWKFESSPLQRRVCELSVPPETKRIESEQFPGRRTISSKLDAKRVSASSRGSARRRVREAECFYLY